MKKFLIIIPLIFLLTGCKYGYRYPCQDPINWGKEFCNNDVCKADGTCTKDTLGFSPKPNQMVDPTEYEPEQLENLKATKNQISKQEVTCPDTSKPKATTQDKPEKKVFKPNKIVEPESEQVSMNEIDVSEKPLTMNTVVETRSHNDAAKITKW